MKGNLRVKLKGDKFEMSAMDGKVKKTFCFPCWALDNGCGFPKFKPNVKWNVEGVVDGLSKIWMFVNRGPLVIESVRDDFPLRWFIAPIRVGKDRGIKR